MPGLASSENRFGFTHSYLKDKREGLCWLSWGKSAGRQMLIFWTSLAPTSAKEPYSNLEGTQEVGADLHDHT